MASQINSRQFPKVYENLNIDLNQLGCVMLGLDPRDMPEFPEEWADDLYYARDPNHFWLDGYVGRKPHLTLLYGLLEQGKKYQEEINIVLKDWELPEVEVADIGFFDTPMKDDEGYYCIVAHILPTPELVEGHQRLELLPHINTFTGYKPHVTLAYVQRDPKIRDKVIDYFREMVGTRLRSDGLNLGGH